MKFQSSFFFKCFIKIQVVQPYNSTDIATATAWKNSHFILSERLYMVINQSIAVHGISMLQLTLLSVDEILLLRYMNWSTDFRGLSFNKEMPSSCLKHMNSFFIWAYIAASLKRCSRDSAWADIFARSTRSSTSSVAIIVSTGCYNLFLMWINFYFIRLINIHST